MGILKRALGLAAATATLMALAAAPGFSAGSPSMNLSFFNGGGGNAHWAANQSVVELTLSGASSYAGFDLHHVATALPAEEPTFSAPSYQAGSPRWVIELSSGSYLFGYPDHTWNVEACSGIRGGAPMTYDQAVAALSADGCTGDVTDVFVVADASQPVPAVDNVSDVQYDGVTLTAQ
ncbi:MAG TPA: hypothetical protein VFI30_01695 [Nocardioidaceae bacterium]|nr:hypothetical protein [Nocardioidaceae bacterium]